MKRLLAHLRRNRRRFEFWAAALLGGALLGLFVLRPINDFVAWHEHEVNAPSALEYVRGELSASLLGLKPTKSLFYAGVGAWFGLLSAFFHGRVLERNQRIERLTSELQHDLAALIAAGEGDLGASLVSSPICARSASACSRKTARGCSRA